MNNRAVPGSVVLRWLGGGPYRPRFRACFALGLAQLLQELVGQVHEGVHPLERVLLGLLGHRVPDVGHERNLAAQGG